MGEVCGSERAVPALGFIEDRNVRFDVLLSDEPAQHVRRAIGRVRGQYAWVQVETLPGSDQHVAHCARFGLQTTP